MSKELTPQKEAGCPAAFPDEPPLSPKKEFFRIRHELGQLLKHAREQERLSAQAFHGLCTHTFRHPSRRLIGGPWRRFKKNCASWC